MPVEAGEDVGFPGVEIISSSELRNMSARN